MNKVIRLGMLFNEGEVPDFGSIVGDVHQRGLYYLLAKDIPKLNTMLTRAAAENYLIGNETFNFFSGYMAYVIDHKEASTGEIYAYHRGKDRWYEFNIRLDKSFNEIMWERHKRILRETKTISGTAPLTFKSNGRTLKNYRIYGNTETIGGSLVSVGEKTTNILPLSRTPITETHGDFLCEYDGFGSITLTTNKDNASTHGLFIIPLMRDFTIPISVGQGGTGCWQMNNNSFGNSLGNIRLMYNDKTIENWLLTEPNRIHSGYVGMANKTINKIAIVIDDSLSYRSITMKPALVENTTQLVLFEPYGYCIPITINQQTTSIFLLEQLAKSGNNADYIDYKTQRRYNADGTTEDIPLPEISVLSGNNTLSVGTEVQPSMVKIKGRLIETN